MQESLAQINAELGFQIALGELQKWAGPDQCATTSLLDNALAWNTTEPRQSHALYASEKKYAYTVSENSVGTNNAVLSNPLHGGLKKDLSDLRRLHLHSSDDLSKLYQWPYINESLYQYVNYNADPHRGVPLLIPQETEEKTRLFVAPLIPELHVMLGVTAEETPQGVPAAVHLLYKAIFLVWNPYPLPLHLNHKALCLTIQGLPAMTLTDGKGEIYRFTLPDIEVCWNRKSPLSPGQVHFAQIPQKRQSETLDTVGAIRIGSLREDSCDPYTVTFTRAETRLAVCSSQKDKNALLELWFLNQPRFTLHYDETKAAKKFRRPKGNHLGGTSSKSLTEPGGNHFHYYYRLKNEISSPQIADTYQRWLEKKDIRQCRKLVLDGEQHEDGITEDAFFTPHPQRMENFFSDTNFFHYHFFSKEEGASQPYRCGRIARLFDLPTRKLTSVASLRHLEFKNKPPLSLGRPEGGELNEVFDRFFFSDFPYIFHYHEKNLLLKGGFNLNSASAKSWENLLEGFSFATWSYTQEKNPTIYKQTPLSHAFFNFPFTASSHLFDQKKTYDFTSSTEDLSTLFHPLSENRQHPAFIQSVRELSSEEIAALSQAIHEKIKAYQTFHKRPFLSVCEFVNSGILESAINMVPSINMRKGDTDTIPFNSPASVTQGTLLESIGPFLQVRSDTFFIRAFGMEEGVKACCEAHVQRVPEELSAEWPFLGRPFKVLSFHWIK